MRAVIFLDVDGVLNSLRSCVGLGGYRADQLDPVAMGLLNALCREAQEAGVQVDVVISSTWRKKYDVLTWWTDLFDGHSDCPAVKVVGMTPSLGGRRGEEVRTWLASNNRYHRHVILDDDNDFDDDQPLILVEPWGGLNLNHIDEAHFLLTGQRMFPEGLQGAGKWGQLKLLGDMLARHPFGRAAE